MFVPEMSLIWLRLAAALYAVGLIQAILSLFRRGESLYPVAVQLFQVGVVLHGVSIVEQFLPAAVGRRVGLLSVAGTSGEAPPARF